MNERFSAMDDERTPTEQELSVLNDAINAWNDDLDNILARMDESRAKIRTKRLKVEEMMQQIAGWRR